VSQKLDTEVVGCLVMTSLEFTAEYTGERILKSGHYLPKLWQE